MAKLPFKRKAEKAPEVELTETEMARKKIGSLSRISAIMFFIAVVATVFAIYTQVTANARVSEVSADLQDVITANVDINPGTVITEDMLSITQVPSHFVSAGAITDSSTIVGSTASVKIARGSQPSVDMVSGPYNTTSLSAKLKTGAKAITISVDSASTLNNLVRPGDTIDLYCNEGNAEETVLRPLIENVEVIAVGTSLSRDANAEDGGDNTSLTVSVSESAALTIMKHQHHSAFKMILNSMGDSK